MKTFLFDIYHFHQFLFIQALRSINVASFKKKSLLTRKIRVSQATSERCLAFYLKGVSKELIKQPKLISWIWNLVSFVLEFILIQFINYDAFIPYLQTQHQT